MRSITARLLRPRTISDLIKTTAAFLSIYALLKLIQTPLRLQPGSSGSSAEETRSPSYQDELPCRNLPGANDTLVIIKTGVTEFNHKLPVHIDTTIRCYPHYLIYSDHEEEFKGQQIIDSLAPISPLVKQTNADFDFYRRVKAGGRQALGQKELSDQLGFGRHPSNEDKMLMGGWRLDKWKFLPMWNETYFRYPDIKWYVFIEADTYMFWSNLLKYTAALDPTEPYYGGAELFIDWTLFAHGGGGVLMSQRAMELYVEEYNSHAQDWETFVNMHWAGDIVLGRLLNAASVTLTPAWPHFHPHAPGNDTFYWADDNRRFLCYPAISYHHVTPEVVSDLWHFEQQWIEKDLEDGKQQRLGLDQYSSVDKLGREALKRRDIFEEYIMHKMEHEYDEWDNGSMEEHGVVSSRDFCRDICANQDKCAQWRFDYTTKKCWTNDEPRWGDAAPGTGYYSGWNMNRVQEYVDNLIPCGQEGWILE